MFHFLISRKSMSILKQSIVFSMILSVSTAINAKEVPQKNECADLKSKGDYVQGQAFTRNISPFGLGCFAIFLAETPEGKLFRPHFYKGKERLASFNPSFLNDNLEPRDSFDCKVEAVSFSDINADELQDILVISTCWENLNQSKTFKNNKVYFNRGENGNKFESYQSVDDKASQYNRISDIKKNLQQ